jgi:uncharacterized protein YajQ (UPF0234 family)
MEVENAVQQASREIAQRYDLKNTGARIELDKAGPTVTVSAPDDFTVKQVVDLLGTKLVRRKVDLLALSWGPTEDASAGSAKRVASVVDGIEAELARTINKDIKAEKLKVKVTIEGDQLRVSGPKKDVLQEVIAFVRSKEYGVPLQFVNYR